MNNREVICLHIGQAGVQLASQVNELLTHEHGLSQEGKIIKKKYDELANNQIETFFYESQKEEGKYYSRSLIADLDSIPVDEFRKTPYSDLFQSYQFQTGTRSAASNFAYGYKEGWEQYEWYIHDKIQKLAETCDNLQGFVMFHSISGGTGSGLGALILDQLTNFGKKVKTTFTLFPSTNMSNVITEPYNALAGIRSLIDFSNISVVLQNEKLYDICHNSLDIEDATYKNLNRVIAQGFSCMTHPMRFGGPANSSLSEIQINLIPFPQTHFLSLSMAPLVCPDTSKFSKYSIKQLTNSAFSHSNHLMDLTLDSGVYLGCSLMYRGDITLFEVSSALNKVSLSQCVGCNHVSAKISLNPNKLDVLPDGDIPESDKSVLSITNHTGMRNLFTIMSEKYELISTNGAFKHWFSSEHMDYLSASEEELLTLIADYADPPQEADPSDCGDENGY